MTLKNFFHSLSIAIGPAFIGGFIAATVVAFLIYPFIDIVDKIFLFFDKSALIYVSDPYDPFRVALEAGFLGSFITTIVIVGFMMGETKESH